MVRQNPRPSIGLSIHPPTGAFLTLMGFYLGFIECNDHSRILFLGSPPPPKRENTKQNNAASISENENARHCCALWAFRVSKCAASFFFYALQCNDNTTCAPKIILEKKSEEVFLFF